MIRPLSFVLPLLGLLACRTAAPLPPVNLSEPGWHVRQGQAVWQPNRQAAEIAGELLVATHQNGGAFVQFTKNPFPIVVARTTAAAWQIEFVSNHQFYSGHGQPPARLVWFQLGRFLRNEPLSPKYRATHIDAQSWRLENKSSGEILEAYLNP